MTKRTIRAPHGRELQCKGWVQEAALRMLFNNLDPDVAEDPDNLVVYGGSGKAARNWECFDRIVASLRELEDDETLLVQSGKAVGIVRTHPDAPRVLIANSNLVGKWANWEHFRELEDAGFVVDVRYVGTVGGETFKFRANGEDAMPGQLPPATAYTYAAEFSLDEDTTTLFTVHGTDPDGDALNYAWDFGDGSTSNEIAPVHSYSAAGTFLVKVKAVRGAFVRYFSDEIIIHESPVAIRPEDLAAGDGAVWVADWYNFITQHNPTPPGFSNGPGMARKKECCQVYARCSKGKLIPDRSPIFRIQIFIKKIRYFGLGRYCT